MGDRRRQGATGGRVRQGGQKGSAQGLVPYSVVYAPEATDQLEKLFVYIAERKSPTVAENYISAVVASCERLALFPMRGVPREDIRPGLRVTHHKGRTVIAYAVDPNARAVSILGVFYGGQDHEAALTGSGDA